MRKPVQVMKFGGTSVGDAACIARVAEIVVKATRDYTVAVVVSAMSGVTNELVEVANRSKAGDGPAVTAIFSRLRKRHNDLVTTLIKSPDHLRILQRTLQDRFSEGESVCQVTLRSGELTARALDAISGLGERLCAPVVAMALLERGIASEAIDATELIVTDSYHGGAEPMLDLTRARCQGRVIPLLQREIVPVITGFIAATEDEVPTTLGRGGSDYSATVLGAALDADEVIIWSDVPGLLTADPKLVADARTIAEISYREAAELAYFGAKVLHPKTLRPVMQRGIALWIKNSFAPEEVGTRITSSGSLNSAGVKSLTSLQDVAMITVVDALTQGVSDVLSRMVATAAAFRADLLLVSQSSAHKDIFLVVPSKVAESTVEALRREISPDLKHQELRDAIFESPVAVITLVGHGIYRAIGNLRRAFAALEQENISVIVTVQGSSDSSMSFVVRRHDVNAALASIHREFGLGGLVANGAAVAEVTSKSAIWRERAEQFSAD